MAVTVKSAREIDLMRTAGKYLEEVHNALAEMLAPGISTWDIDKKGEEIIRKLGCVPNFLNYSGFPASICVSVNEEVIHGIPDKKHFLEEGDIVSLDAGYTKAIIRMPQEHTESERSPMRHSSLLMLRSSHFSKASNSQRTEIIFMTSRPRSEIMLTNTATES